MKRFDNRTMIVTGGTRGNATDSVDRSEFLCTQKAECLNPGTTKQHED